MNDEERDARTAREDYESEQEPFTPDWANYRQGKIDGARDGSEWVGLTDDERYEAVREAAVGSAMRRDGSTSERIAKAIEAKLKEKNK